MLKSIDGIEPVAIALESIDMADDVAFAGVDLETGARVRVMFERNVVPTAAPDRRLAAAGLILTLTVHSIHRAA